MNYTADPVIVFGFVFFVLTVRFCLAGCRGRDSIYNTPVSLSFAEFCFRRISPRHTPRGCIVLPRHKIHSTPTPSSWGKLARIWGNSLRFWLFSPKRCHICQLPVFGSRDIWADVSCLFTRDMCFDMHKTVRKFRKQRHRLTSHISLKAILTWIDHSATFLDNWFLSYMYFKTERKDRELAFNRCNTSTR